MYSYEWDEETGGYLLLSTPSTFSKEPRPVYYKELDILGFDKYWTYKKDDTNPYMWAEANNYIYRGKLVAKTKGGSLHTAPEIILNKENNLIGQELQFVDIDKMVEKNKTIMDSLANETIKRVYNTYIEYKDKIDVFYVAFSGGKDSIALLDIVQRALPHDAFKVVFGDTGMEFLDTYDAVSKMREYCKSEKIDFITSHSHLSPLESWKMFGPPATVTRWCCSVHKTTPQIISLRKLLNKDDFTGMAFIGVRADESLARSEYDYVSLGEKHKGQYSFNPLLEWNSAELFLYTYSKNLIFNESYKKGNRRAGCLLCPRAAERNDFMSCACYKDEAEKFIDIIRNLYHENFTSQKLLENFIEVGGWKARKNGRDLSLTMNYTEYRDKKSNLMIKIDTPKTDWKTWIKTIGVLTNDASPYTILFRNKNYSFSVDEENNTLLVTVEEFVQKSDPIFVKLLKNVFRKAACCVGCRECEADCHNGCIIMENGILKISDNCSHCSQCHKVEKGCLVYKSLEMPKGGFKMQNNKSLNCYSHHAPKMDWFKQYFEYKNDFSENHTLGSQMFNFFKRFLRDAELLDEKGFTKTAEIISKLELRNFSGWGIMLSNLSYTPQIQWYVKNIKFNEECSKEYLLSLLIEDGAKESWVNDIWSSLSRILDLPFGKIGLGNMIKEKNKNKALIRTAWETTDPKVILYSLYKFAEACGDYYQFTLTRLMNFSIDSDGVSPAEIFGLSREEMEQILSGLTINFPDFIHASFTLDLDNVTLRSEKTSEDVLEIFKES